MSKNLTPLTESAKAVLEILAASDKPLTIAELNERTNVIITPGHISGLIKRGLIYNAGQVAAEVASKRPNKVYELVTDAVQTNPATGKVCNYTDAEKSILVALKDAAEPLTLAQLSELVGKVLISGNINGLVTKGNVAIAGEIEVPCTVKKKVGTYALAARDAE